MIVNNYVVAYFVLLASSLAICLPAGAVALLVAASWRPGLTTDEQTRLEKRAYLVIALLNLGFLTRVAMIPAWFLTIGSLVPYIPGAMCMAGVHEMDSPISYLDTALKFLIPLAYIYWLVLDGADRRVESEPFMRTKLLLVAPLAGLMVFESALDVHFLGQVKPAVVRCCTSIFDVPRSGALQAIRDAGWAWTPLFLFYFVCSLALAALLRRKSSLLVGIACAVSTLAALLFFVLALHTRVSPLLLEAPYHQCVFCLWQKFPDIAAASGAVAVGAWLLFAVAALPGLARFPAASAFAGKLVRLASALLAAGTLEVALRYALGP